MRISRAWTGLPLVLALAACAGDADVGDDGLVDETEVVTPIEEPQTAETPAMEVAEETSAFQPLQDSGVTGEATITPQDQQTQVMVQLTGASGAGEHPGHLHSGSCDDVGGVVQPLEPVTTDASGTGSMTATVAMPPMTAMDGQHIVVYHAAGGGPPITCAPIPAHTM
ncbi:MAG: hypothetical protein GEU90_10265 [Gemmatimonas sp.]|nr:hypothetical protein [Gemmatimonas sp.]